MPDALRTPAGRRAGERGPHAARGARSMTATVVALALLTGCSGADPAADAGTPAATPSAPAGDRGTPTASPEPVVPTPDEHSAVGDLPDGFPADLLPVPPGAEILVATYAPEAAAGAEQPYAVSLNVRTAMPVDDVVALYRSSLTAAGFVENAGEPSGSLTAEATFSRSGGQEIVVVGVLDRDGTRTVTVGGRVRAAA